MPLDAREKTHIRDLAKRVAEIAADPYNEERRQMWYRHNALERVKPMVLIFPEGSWEELMPESTMVCEDPTWRRHEFYLRHLIYRWEHLRDDNVIEPYLQMGAPRGATSWGLEMQVKRSEAARGAFAYDPVLKGPEDFAKMVKPHYHVDHDKKKEMWDEATDAVGDILTVRWTRGKGINTSLVNQICNWHGLEQTMSDMIERPEFLHEIFTFLMEGTQTLLDELEASGELEANNSNDYAGSGGVCYSKELPGDDDGPIMLKDIWGFAESQEYTLVSPRMYDEFGLKYQAPLLERCGLNCYACCEGLDDKLDLIMEKVPNLRRLSISPWTDVNIAAEKLEDKIIYSWKPPPMLVTDPYDTDYTRKYTRDFLEATKGNVVEMILKDTHTCNHQPQRLTDWVEICKELAEDYA
jgi:hypothetical protein